jgi:hypothetical protein
MPRRKRRGSTTTRSRRSGPKRTTPAPVAVTVTPRTAVPSRRRLERRKETRPITVTPLLRGERPNNNQGRRRRKAVSAFPGNRSLVVPILGTTPTRRRVQKRLVSTQSRDDATRRRPAPPCAVSKQTRRAVIIATGHGGRNNVKEYRRHKKC